MSSSDSEDLETAGGLEFRNPRNRKNGHGSDAKTNNVSEVSSQRHFQKRSHYEKQSTHQYERSRDRSSNRRPFGRGRNKDRYTTQPTNSVTLSGNSKYKPCGSNGSGFMRYGDNIDQRMQYFNITQLEHLGKMRSKDLVTTLVNLKTEFEEFLNRTLPSDLLVLTLSVLANLCRDNSTEDVASILSHACSDTFLTNLENFLTTLCFERESHTIKHNKLYWNNRNGFWQNMIDIFKKMIDLLPGKARDELTGILGKINTIITSIENNQDYAIDKNVKKAASDMFDELQQQLTKFEPITTICKTISKELDEEPPENFRYLCVIPRKQDILNRKPFLRANKVKEAYDSVEHYLDVQFRLLREDFMTPLHDGLEEYLNDTTQRQNKNFRIYRKVRFVPRKPSQSHSGYTIFFGVKKKVNWNDSKRFMFGELLCLSRDNFNSILFATVVNRNETDLKKGLLVIKLWYNSTAVAQNLYDSDFVMLESKLYFEPYFVVLNSLCRMNDKNFPMKNYLVDATTSTLRPRYLNNEEIRLQYKGFLLPIAANKAWPSPEKLQLDEMQYQAFKCALTEELAVIQGPPGTGKTFLALQIIGTLLDNDEHWLRYGPIIVVCLTNHALDQFLEGILDYTDSIVRIGNQSKSPRLIKYTLKNRLHTSRLHPESREDNSYDSCEEDYYSMFNGDYKKKQKKRYLPPTIAQRNMFDARDDLNVKLDKIENTYWFIGKLNEKNAILPLRRLKQWCNDPVLDELTTQEELLNWLLRDIITSITAKNSMYLVDGLESPWIIELFDLLVQSYDDEYDSIFPLECIDQLIHEINTRIVSHRSETEMHELPFDPTNDWEYDIYELQMLRWSIEHELAQHPLINMGNQGQPQHPHWEAYWRFITLSYEGLLRNLTWLQSDADYLTDELNFAKEIVDLEELRKYKVIGLTTTAAARLHGTLKSLHAPIVLVEEAAEILESQVVCCLTESCQHLILIGDHKQLRPKPAVYELGTKYNLNISLFERMVNIRGNHTQLANQHRMRPEIARLICPSIYETLHNDESVCKYPSVEGLDTNLFFLHHTHHEVNSEYNEDSWANPHEAKFLVAFARHLLLQGYSRSEITILCTYSGQLSTLMKEKARYRILEDLRITTVDNYQGEENKIILLSLVRNNEEGNIGFLKEENRVCVALSRAREGLYMMGNMDNLITKNQIWPKIKKVLEDNNEIGNSLELRCQIHPEEVTRVQDAEDFEKCPKGGCLKQCNTYLSCGHICISVCHSWDQEHEDYECSEPCNETCPRAGHPCPLICAKVCEPCLLIDDRELKCGHTVPVPCWEDSDKFSCPIMVDAILPGCNHAVLKPCHKSVADYPCSYPCDMRLPCGHTCELNCHANNDPDHLEYKCKQDCTKYNLNCTMDHACKKQCGEECSLCDILRKKERSCGHYFDCKCTEDVEEILCTKPCKRQMNCGHKCQLKCDEICGKCQEQVVKTSTCGHTIKVNCHEEATPTKCNGNCQRKLACGHPCTAKCKDPCITACKIMIPQTKPGLCGHIFAVPCHMQECQDSQKLLRYCKEPCKTELACGHICKGNCGSCKQGRIHVPCGENCGNVLICGHRCEVPCSQECPPCKKVCKVKCRHRTCKRKCGESCVPCKEKCGWGCPHSKCSKRCFELCDREPCTELCCKTLKCGHPCVGFCGEPCPQLCRICDKEELMNAYLPGHESEPDTRFILLEDCGHCIESQELLKWVSDCSLSIQMIMCPRCKTPISKCMRLMNQIKTNMKDMQLIRNKIFGDQTQLQEQQLLLRKEIELMAENPVLKIFSNLKNFLDTLQSKVFPATKKNKLQVLDAGATEAIKIKLNILRQILDKLENIDHTVKIHPWLQDQIVMIVQSLSIRGQISDQEINDINPELRRLHYMVEISIIMNLEKVFEHSDSSLHEISFKAIIEKLTSINKFSETTELYIQQEITRLPPLMELKKAITVDAKQKMTVKTMSFRQGHWFKCPNGHIYSIANCDSTTIVGKCNECGASTESIGKG